MRTTTGLSDGRKRLRTISSRKFSKKMTVQVAQISDSLFVSPYSPEPAVDLVQVTSPITPPARLPGDHNRPVAASSKMSVGISKLSRTQQRRVYVDFAASQIAALAGTPVNVLKLKKYVYRTFKEADIPCETLIIAVLYLNRAISGGFELTASNVDIAAVCAMFLGSKFIEDEVWSNGDLAKFARRPLTILNQVELEIVKAADFNLYVDEVQYMQFLRSVQVLPKEHSPRPHTAPPIDLDISRATHQPSTAACALGGEMTAVPATDVAENRTHNNGDMEPEPERRFSLKRSFSANYIVSGMDVERFDPSRAPPLRQLRRTKTDCYGEPDSERLWRSSLGAHDIARTVQKMKLSVGASPMGSGDVGGDVGGEVSVGVGDVVKSARGRYAYTATAGSSSAHSAGSRASWTAGNAVTWQSLLNRLHPRTLASASASAGAGASVWGSAASCHGSVAIPTPQPRYTLVDNPKESLASRRAAAAMHLNVHTAPTGPTPHALY
eukprot:GFYU01000294.1.p1 GENE.GFYU01000294.1~~GFYU01000294.1.p1  ORF type:complete len:496 (+),score=99.50 GFYU01000294.1:79-1566(+)